MPTATIPRFSPSRFLAALEQSGQTRIQVARSLNGCGRTREINGLQQLRRYADGTRKPTLDTVYKLANALGVQPLDLCEVGDE